MYPNVSQRMPQLVSSYAPNVSQCMPAMTLAVKQREVGGTSGWSGVGGARKLSLRHNSCVLQEQLI